VTITCCFQVPAAGVRAGRDGARVAAPGEGGRQRLRAARGLPLRARLHREPQEEVQRKPHLCKYSCTLSP
jgi:hypothetical protein